MGKKKKTINELLKKALVAEEEQPYDIPDNWVWSKLNCINSKKSNNISPQKHLDEYFELYSVPSYEEKYPVITQGKDVKSNKYVVTEDDVLLCKINPRINRVWIVENYSHYRKIASTEWIVINTKRIYPKYLMWVLRSNYFRILLETNVSGVGGSLTRARPKEVRNYPVPIPPRHEQIRIVNKIENLFERIDRAKELTEEAREGFENRKAAMLSKAFRGELTKKWRKENTDIESVEMFLAKKKIIKDKEIDWAIKPEYELPEKWRWVRLGDIYKFRGGGTPSKRKKEYWDGNINWASVKDISGKFLYHTQDKITQEGLENSSTRMVNENELILVTRMSPGKSTIANITTAINQDLKVAKTDFNINSLYTYYFFQFIEDQILHLSKGTTVKGVRLDVINNIAFPFPPLDEQEEIVRILENLFKKENKINKLTNKNNSIVNLKKAILSKAFRGELGTNNLNDENALELLKEVLIDSSEG